MGGGGGGGGGCGESFLAKQDRRLGVPSKLGRVDRCSKGNNLTAHSARLECA